MCFLGIDVGGPSPESSDTYSHSYSSTPYRAVPGVPGTAVQNPIRGPDTLILFFVFKFVSIFVFCVFVFVVCKLQTVTNFKKRYILVQVFPI